ncbi:Max dimerization protein 1 [Taenia crassiceps]|uniref:Max dimerization protein 1 n=1 Tax=Taenia crassiceps TaxID=6207 RepID=A0ABR4QLN1_9CEST
MTESPLKDGLLLLLQAAQKIDRESKSACHHPERWEARTGSSRHFYDDGPTHFPSPYSSSSIHRRSAPSTRCTHNELEKSRRAHLRTCMDALKELLVFDTEAPRITTLTVLRKATSTIQQLQQRNEYLEACEDGEKQRFSQLMKRRQALRKKIEAKRNRTLKIQNWRERNRNYSECSVLTTSSEDSELGYGSRHMPSNMYSILPLPHHQQQQQLSANDNHRYASPYGTTASVVATTPNSTTTKAAATASTMISDSVTTVTAPATATSAAAITYAASQAHHNLSHHQKVAPHSPHPSAGANGMSPTDAYDASSSDSGFEEVITATNAVDEQQTLKMVPSVVSTTEEVVYAAYQSGDCFKGY